ncbi:MAG: MMPL family transporter, partial [Methanomassiliicoccaceae archaeon]|nr:MMPL family transporter [Methanomassiliicoccaceae archaeon]
MEFMKKAGESMAKRPFIPIAILIMITVASLGVIAVNPPSFDMEEGGFTPDNEMTRASNIISEEFTTATSVMSMADARNAGRDIFTQEMFVDILTYERSLAEMQYTDKDGNKQNYSDLSIFMINSPVSAIAQAMVGSTDYDVLIAAFKSGAITTAAIKTTASAILSDPSAMMLVSLLTSDRIVEAGNVSASGCMISITVMDADLDIIHDGQNGFEKDIISTAKSFAPATGLNIRVAGMVTMMNDIGSLAQKDIAMLLPIAIIVIALLLLLIYRDLRDTLVGLLGLLIAVVWTFGIAILAGIEMSTIAIAVPILIIALGIDYSLHLVFRYREERR